MLQQLNLVNLIEMSCEYKAEGSGSSLWLLESFHATSADRSWLLLSFKIHHSSQHLVLV